MKTPPAAIALWVVNFAVLAGGGFFIFKAHSGFQADRVSAAEAITTYKPRKAETWDELVTRSTDHLLFEKVRLVPGDPEVLPREAEVGNGPDVPKAKPPVDLAAPLRILEDAAKKAFTEMRPDEIGSLVQVSMVIKVGEWSNYQYIDAGSDLIALLNPEITKQLPFDRCVLAGLGVGKVLFNVSSAGLRSKIEEARKDQETRKDPVSVIDLAIRDGILTPDAQNGVLQIPYEWVGPKNLTLDALKRLAEGIKPSTSGTESGSSDNMGVGAVSPDKSGPGSMPDPKLLKPNPQPDPAATAPVDSFTYDKKSDAWSIQSFTQETVESLGSYVETATDAKGNQIGLRVRDNLPSDESNAAYKMGARSGDIVKSINGTAVKSMQEIRTIVGNQRNAGETKFTVVFERNGVDQTKVINAPPLPKK
jgi:hypothetical protein